MGRLKQDTPMFPYAPHYGGRRPSKPSLAPGDRVRDRLTGNEGTVSGAPFALEGFAPLGQHPHEGPDSGTFQWVDWHVHVQWPWGIDPIACASLTAVEE